MGARVEAGRVTRLTDAQASILARLRDAPRQAQEVAAELGIDTSAARRHLENLREMGLVEPADVVEGRGRPKKRYAITPAGREAFPRDYALLLDLVLAKLGERRDRRELESLMRLVAKDLAAGIEGDSTAARLRGLLAFYNRLGFDASLERAGGETVLEQRNCIVLKTARGDPALLCECFDEGILRAALPGARVRLLASQARGDATCRHAISQGR